jgi:hypothetical protein
MSRPTAAIEDNELLDRQHGIKSRHASSTGSTMLATNVTESVFDMCLGGGQDTAPWSRRFGWSNVRYKRGGVASRALRELLAPMGIDQDGN